MKYLSIGIAVAAAAGAWAWWLHKRGHDARGVAPAPRVAGSARRPGVDDGILRTPPNPDRAMLRTPANPDPKMAFDPTKRTTEQRSGVNNGRKL